MSTPVKKYRSTLTIMVLVVIIIVSIILTYINNNSTLGIGNIPYASKTDLQDGKMLAARYCQSCHMLPDPSLLTKEMWYTGVLNRMGPFLGYTSFRGQHYERANDVSLSYFPSKPVLDSAQWSHLIAYYMYSAPNRMPEQQKKVPVIKNLPFFTILAPPANLLNSAVAMTSYAKIDTLVTPHRLIVCDGLAARFVVCDDQLQILSSSLGAGPIVDLNFTPNGILACNIGANLEANNLHNGQVREINIDRQGKISVSNTALFDSLSRPVKVNRADLDGDGREDYIISQFGNLVGDLSWYENKGNGKFEKHLLRAKPGALNTIVQDVNHDGLPDIWAQFAQGDECIMLYINKGHGQFEEKQVLRFPPSYGSTSFDVVDFNHDGFPDIIYTCGDNGDYTPILKPYHGVYIFLNDGKNNFKQKYFYPINGCYKAIARDFQGNGHLDIATISFYPSDQQPEEAFIYLENKGNFKFQPYSLPLSTPFQKGITMDAGDLDGDHKLDIVLGNGYFNSDTTGKQKQPLFIVLKNKTKGNSNK